MKVKDLMSRKPITVTPSTSIENIWSTIFIKNISGLPVVDRHKNLLGIISEEDLIQRLYPSHEEYFLDPSESRNFENMETNFSKLKNFKARDVMNKQVFVTREETPMMRAAALMLLYKVSCLPVVRPKKNKKKLVGILCKGDVFSHLFKSHLAKSKKKLKS